MHSSDLKGLYCSKKTNVRLNWYLRILKIINIKSFGIDANSANYATITKEQRITGLRSLKIAADKEATDELIKVSSPEKAVRLDKGDYRFSMRLWVDTSNSLSEFNVTVNNANGDDAGFVLAPFNLSEIDHAHKAQWITVSQDISLNAPVANDAKLTITVDPSQIKDVSALFYIDDISVVKQ